MAVTQLAVSDDVAAALGRTLTPTEAARVGAILDKASENFRYHSGQTFTEGASVVRLKVNSGRVYLTQRPVVAVATVFDDDGAEVPFTAAGQWLTVDLPSDAFVTVDYTHGGEVPDLVRLCIGDHASRALLVPVAAQAGATTHTETRGPFTTSDTFAAWAVASTFSPEDKALTESIRQRNRARSVIVMRS